MAAVSAAEPAVPASTASSAPLVAAGRSGPAPRARARRKLQVLRIVVLSVLGVYFALPLLSLFEFSTRGIGIDAPRTFDAWGQIVTDDRIRQPIVDSLELAALTSVITLVLMVPTLIWAQLRAPRLSRAIEFICLLPLTIPPIVLIVGLAPIYRWMARWETYLFHTDTILILTLAYVVLTLPYVYRALDTGLRAIDVKTLAEAARSLGAGWFSVMYRVIVPNMAAAILNAGLLCVAIVLGEFTFASLLNYVNLQVAINQLGQSDASLSFAVSEASLLFAFALLLLLSFVGSRRFSRKG
jgi:putative spermidine/putrescine transport system permease protein